MKKKKILAWVVLVIKIGLAVGAFFLVATQSSWLFGVLALFILVDFLDGRFLGEDFRLWDTIGDRIFAYACFLSLILFAEMLYPILLLIIIFLVKDLTVVGLAHLWQTGTVKSTWFDRLVILGVAVFFAFSALGRGKALLEMVFLPLVLGVMIQLFLKVKKLEVQKYRNSKN